MSTETTRPRTAPLSARERAVLEARAAELDRSVAWLLRDLVRRMIRDLEKKAAA